MSAVAVRWRGAPMVALVALTAALHIVESRVPVFHAQPLMQPDSVSYLEANIARTPLYPLILRGVHKLPGGLASLGPLQHLALVSSALVLAYRFTLAFGRPLLAALLAASIVLNPQVVSYCFTVLPEALFLTALMIHLSFVLTLATGWRRWAAVGAGASAAVLALIKPSGFAVVAGLGVLAIVHRAGWRRIGWLIAPTAAVLLIACVGNYVARGLFAIQSQGGYSRAAYVGQFLDETTPSAYQALVGRIAAQTSAARRAMEALPSLEMYYLIGSNQYHAVEAIVHDEILAEIGRERGTPVVDPQVFPSDPDVVTRLDEIAGTLASDAIRWRPRDYARQVAANVYGLWWLPLVRSAGGVSVLQREVDATLSRFPALDRSPMAFKALPWPAYAMVRLWLGAVVVCGLFSLIVVWSSDRRWATVGYVGALVHGSFLLVSLAQPGLPRYALAVWPASMLLLLATVAMSVNRLRG